MSLYVMNYEGQGREDVHKVIDNIMAVYAIVPLTV